MSTQDWAARVAAIWDRSDELGDDEVVKRIDALVAELPPDDPEGPFEAAGARDSAGLEAEAAPLYQRALDLGLAEPNRSRAFIQYGSTLRNLGRYDEALDLLDELPSDSELTDAASAVRALVLVSAGRASEGAGVAIRALASHLPRYQRSMTNYANELIEAAE